MRNLTQNLVATSYSQFYLVSYHTQKPHLDNFNLYHPVKMSSPTFSATIPFSMTSPRVYVVLRPPASQMPQHPRNIYCPTTNQTRPGPSLAGLWQFVRASKLFSRLNHKLLFTKTKVLSISNHHYEFVHLLCIYFLESRLHANSFHLFPDWNFFSCS